MTGIPNEKTNMPIRPTSGGMPSRIACREQIAVPPINETIPTENHMVFRFFSDEVPKKYPATPIMSSAEPKPKSVPDSEPVLKTRITVIPIREEAAPIAIKNLNPFSVRLHIVGIVK